MDVGEYDFLLIVDVQLDFCAGGALAVPGGEGLVPVINRMMAKFPHIGLTQDWHPAGHHSFASAHTDHSAFETIQLPYGPQTLWPDHCIQGSVGAEFHKDLDTTPAEIIIRKGFRREIDSYSAFRENDRRTPTGLAGFLNERGIKHIFLAGLATDYCVRHSAEDARREGFDVTVVEDACRAIDLDDSLALACAAMASAGVAMVSSLDVLA